MGWRADAQGLTVQVASGYIVHQLCVCVSERKQMGGIRIQKVLDRRGGWRELGSVGWRRRRGIQAAGGAGSERFWGFQANKDTKCLFICPAGCLCVCVCETVGS